MGRLGRPSHNKPVVWYKGFLYQAASWKTARRVAAKVEFHCGELFPRVGFIVTNLETPSRGAVRFYIKRGTAEQWIKEGKQAMKMTRLSYPERYSNPFGSAISASSCRWRAPFRIPSTGSFYSSTQRTIRLPSVRLEDISEPIMAY
jgi:hypothetical protein